MTSNAPASPLRCLVVATFATLGCGGLILWLLPAVATGGAAFDAVLVRLCAGVGIGATAALWAAIASTVLAALRGRPRSAAGVPAPLRRLVLAACGVALAGGVAAAGPAQATPGHPHQDHGSRPAAIAGLPLPDRATAADHRRAGHVVVVAPGDSLWSIAARDLGPGASEAEVAAHWRRIYEHNRVRIGPDPDLIRPAQRLEVLP